MGVHMVHPQLIAPVYQGYTLKSFLKLLISFFLAPFGFTRETEPTQVPTTVDGSTVDEVPQAVNPGARKKANKKANRQRVRAARQRNRA